MAPAQGADAGCGARVLTALPILLTPRLRLRSRNPDDATALFATMSDPVAMRWSRAPFEDADELRDYFADFRGDRGWRCWAIARHGDSTALGFVATHAGRRGVSEVGYLLARDAWGQGIAHEAVAAVIDRLFAEGKRRVFADTDPDNRASNALLARLGFRREARLHREWETHIGWRDSVIWGVRRGDWTPADQRARRAA